MALINMELMTKIGLILGRKKNVKDEEEEEEKKRKKRSSKPRYGTLDFWYGNQP